jgi:DNA-binding CsgD family transcriptional regulator/tetratricopeptide (TPR) repeat protein
MTNMHSANTALFGREPQLAALGDLIDHVRDRGGALVVTGEPGVGKSALLRQASMDARKAGMLVLTMSGVQSESLLPFAGLHQLLGPVLGQLNRLASPQRDALRAALGVTDGDADAFLTSLAVLNLLAASAASVPVLVIAEDAHWLDRPTVDAMAFVARRLEFEPILMLITVRDDYQGAFSDAGLPSMHLGPLSGPAAEALVDSSAPGLPGAARERLLAESAGNPLALIELPIAYRQLGPDVIPPERLPLTTRLERAFAARVAELPSATRTALLIAAVNDGPLLGEVLAATRLLAGAESSLDVLDPAISALLVDVSESEVRFRHPLMRTAIHQQASISQRHAAHAVLHHVLAAQPGRALWHRAASVIGPDEAVASELEAAATLAQQRGGASVAVQALHRAARLSDGPQRVTRLLLAAELGFELGQHDLVLNLIKEAELLGLGPGDQARATWIKESFADGVPGDAAQVRSLAELASRAATDGNSDFALKLLYGAALRCWWGDPGQAARDSVVATASRFDVPEDDPRLLVILAFAEPIAQGTVVIDRLSRLAAGDGTDAMAIRHAGNAAMAVGAFGLASGFFASSVAGLRAQGRLGLLARALALQAWVAVQVTDLDTAIPAADEARRLARETMQPLIMATAEAVQALLAALRGDADEAVALASRAEQTSMPAGGAAVLAATQLARGLAALSGGDPAAALGHLRRIHDPADPAYHQAIRCFTIGDLAEAAVHGGDPEGIRVIMAEMEAQARRTTSPSLHASLRYARAMVASDEQARMLFDAALRSDMSTAPFLRARVQLAYGEWLHRQRENSAAREPLRAARDGFDALGMIPWSDRARQQLRSTGETSRRRTPAVREQLTPQELQIVQMAADGLSNRQIGQKLYLSPRTVSSHLYRVFPKLGITSRTELRAAIGTSGAPRPLQSGRSR